MGFLGRTKPRKAQLLLDLGAEDPDAEALLIFLRSGQVLSVMTEHGWEPAEQAHTLQVRQGVRRYVYPVVDVPGAAIDYQAVSAGALGRQGRVALVLSGPAEAMDSAGPVLQAVSRLITARYDLRPTLKGA